MPFYNSNPPAHYGQGLRYKSASGPHAKHVMKKVLRNWNRKNRKDRIAFGKTLITKITGNADLPTPMPSIVTLTAVVDAADAADAAVDAAELALKQLRLDRDAKIDAAVALYDQEASTAEGATGGNEVKLVGLGFELQKDKEAIGALGIPQDLRASAGDVDGSLDCIVDALYGADSYEWQTATNPNDAASWVPRATTTQSSGRLAGLPSGTRHYVRVRGIGTIGSGPWSDVASKMVP